MELDAIILNWNASDETIRCVRAIESWSQVRPTIWVVDNGSSAESVRALRQACPRVRLICSPENQGFAGGNNRAIEQAMARGSAPILLLNNDAFVGEEAVIHLLHALDANERIGVIGPLLFDADDAHRLLSAGGRNIALHTHSHLLDIGDGKPLREVDYVPGTVVIIRSDVLRTTGLLDEDFFFGGEVADLCERARQQGYVSAVDTRVRAVHTLSRSSAIRESLHIYYVFRNRFLFIRKHLGVCRSALYPFWTLYGLGMFIKAQASGKRTKARAIRIGLLDGWIGRFGNQNERVLSAGSSRDRRTGRAQP